MDPMELLDTPTPPPVVETLIDQVESLSTELSSLLAKVWELQKTNQEMTRIVEKLIRNLPRAASDELYEDMRRRGIYESASDWGIGRRTMWKGSRDL